MWRIPVLLCLVAASEAPRADQRRLEAYNVQQVAKLTASDAESGDYFGSSVAIGGDTIVVGSGSEAAYVLRTTDGGATYDEVTKLTAAAPWWSDAAATDFFGNSVAIDGDTVVVGARLDDDAGSNSGSAYVFRTTNGGSTYAQVAKLTASDAYTSDEFGYSVAIDGATIVAGAPYDDGNNCGYHCTDSGAVYVFHTTDGGATYDQVARLTPSGISVREHRFGYSVAIYGNTVVVGSWGDAGKRGAAYVFRTSDGATYYQVAKLTGSDTVSGDHFGVSVAIDGDTILVGANYAGTDEGGSVYVFRTSDGYDQVAKLTAVDAAYWDNFGRSVAIDGGTVVVGASGDDDGGSGSGSVYVFRTTDGGASYGQLAKLTAADASSSDYFGVPVAIAGGTVVVGAPYDDDAGPSSGSVYVFDPNMPTFQPTPQPTSRPTTPQPTPKPKSRQQPELLATILICVAVAVVFACGCLAYARYVRYGSREGPKSDLEPLAEPEGTTPAPTKEATVLSIPPEAELEAEAEAEQPPPPTKGWFWRAEPEVEEPEAEELPRQEIAVEEEPLPPPAKSWWFGRAEPEPEAEDAERPPPLSPFSMLRAEREQELAFEPEPEA